MKRNHAMNAVNTRNVTIGFAVLLGIVIATCLSFIAQAGPIYQFQEGVWNGLDGNATGYTMEDCFISTANKDGNFSEWWSALIVQRPASGARNPLLRFDLSAASGASFNKAQLVLTYAGGSASNANLELYELPAANTAWTESSATWNNQATGTPWKDADGNDLIGAAIDGSDPMGGTYHVAGLDGLLLDSFSVSALQDGDQVVFDLPADRVQAWIDDPASFSGIFLHATNSGSSGGDTQFYSSYYGDDPTVRPLMIIPEPSTSVLLILAAGACLNRRRCK